MKYLKVKAIMSAMYSQWFRDIEEGEREMEGEDG